MSGLNSSTKELIDDFVSVNSSRSSDSVESGGSGKRLSDSSERKWAVSVKSVMIGDMGSGKTTLVRSYKGERIDKIGKMQFRDCY